MKLLLKAIKDKVTATSSLSSLNGRTRLGIVNNLTMADGPYCRVSVPGNQQDYAFNDVVPVDKTQVQLSVFASALNTADDLIDKLVAAFRTPLTLDDGSKASGTPLSRGVLVEAAKQPDGDPTFHSLCVIEFVSNGG